MRKEPAFDYVCEVCGERFPSTQKYAAEMHEKKCLEKKRRRENCSRCGGKGKIYGSYEDTCWEDGPFGSDGDWVTKTRYGMIPCPVCSE